MPHVNSKLATHELKFASWNVRSLVHNKPKQLAALAGANNLDFVIIQEIRREETHGDKISGSYCLWCTSHNGSNSHGVGFLVHDRIEVLEFKIHKIANSLARAAQLTIATKKGRRSIYALYAPHSGYGEDLIQHFWEDATDLPDIAKSIVGVDANQHVRTALPSFYKHTRSSSSQHDENVVMGRSHHFHRKQHIPTRRGYRLHPIPSQHIERFPRWSYGTRKYLHTKQRPQNARRNMAPQNSPQTRDPNRQTHNGSNPPTK
jgi:hypothetical protein